MGGADGDAVELGCHVARTGADEEAVGELCFTIPSKAWFSQVEDKEDKEKQFL